MILKPCIILAVLLQFTIQLQPDQSTQSKETNNKNFFQFTSYFVILFIYSCIILDLSMITIIHLKHHQFYQTEHFILIGSSFFLELINNLIMIFKNKQSLQTNFLKFEILLFLFQIMQISLGILIMRQLLTENINKQLFIMRLIHRFWGVFIYLFIKIQYLYYLYKYLEQNIFLFIILLFFTCLIISSGHVVIFYYLNMKQHKKQIQNYLSVSSKQQTLYKELLKSIEMGEFENVQNDLTLGDLQPKLTFETNFVSAQQKIKWTLIENKVYEIGKLSHPLGQFMLKQFYNKDITREIYGLKALMFKSIKDKEVRVLKHKHQQKTFNLLQQICVGEMSFGDLIIQKQNTDQNQSMESKEGINLFQMKNKDVQKVKTESQKNWVSAFIYDLSIYQKIILLSQADQNFQYNLQNYWIKNLGKYFLVSDENNNKEFAFIINSLSPQYNAYKKQYLQNLNNELSRQILNAFEISQFHLFKKYETIPLQQFQLCDNYLPLVLKQQQMYNLKLTSFSKLKVVGPLGFGNGISPHSSNKFLLVIKDEGIVPFVDMLEFIIQRGLIENFPDTNNLIFTSDYLYTFNNNLEICIYFECSEKFEQMNKIIGLPYLLAIEKVKQFCQTSQTGRKNISGIIQKVIFNSDSFVSQKSSLIKYVNLKVNDFEIINKLFREEEFKGFDKVVISGSDDFALKILKTCNFGDECVFVV